MTRETFVTIRAMQNDPSISLCLASYRCLFVKLQSIRSRTLPCTSNNFRDSSIRERNYPSKFRPLGLGVTAVKKNIRYFRSFEKSCKFRENQCRGNSSVDVPRR